MRIPEERTDQSSTHLMTDFFHRAADGSHGDHDPEYRRDNSEAWQSVGRTRQGRDGIVMFTLKDVNFRIEQCLKCWSVISFHRPLQCAADEFHQMVIVGNLGIFLKSRVLL
jgi:hypothetical protein